MELPPIRGVVFDMDGTLVHQALDFDALRVAIGVPMGQGLLEGMATLPAADRRRAWTLLHDAEMAAAATAELLPGVAAFLARVDAAGVRRAVLTRNSRPALNAVFARCGLTFEIAVARDDAPPKPDPAGLLGICRAWGFAPAEVLMVGDYVYDLQAGRAAGTRTALVSHGREWPFADLADVVFPCFTQLPPSFVPAMRKC